MTKADIVRQVSENTGIDKKEVGAVIESSVGKCSGIVM